MTLENNRMIKNDKIIIIANDSSEIKCMSFCARECEKSERNKKKNSNDKIVWIKNNLSDMRLDENLDLKK